MQRRGLSIILALFTVSAVIVWQNRRTLAGSQATDTELEQVPQPSDVQSSEAKAKEGSPDMSSPTPKDTAARVEAAPPSSPAMQASALVPARKKPVEALIQRQFQAARQAFQQKDAIAQSSPDEVHHTPRQTIEAAQQLGTLAELEAQYPEEAASFQDFYWDCARDELAITVIRSQCLDKYVRLAQLDAVDRDQVLQQFPADILRLYEALQ